MAASLPEPGQTRSLAPNAEKSRKEYADWVSTVEDQFVKKEGKRLAELVHDEQFVKAKGIVELLGIDKPVSKRLYLTCHSLIMVTRNMSRSCATIPPCR